MMRTFKIVSLGLLLTVSLGGEAAGAALEKFGVMGARVLRTSVIPVATRLPAAVVPLYYMPATIVPVRAFSAVAVAGEDKSPHRALADSLRQHMANMHEKYTEAQEDNIPLTMAYLQGICATHGDAYNKIVSAGRTPEERFNIACELHSARSPEHRDGTMRLLHMAWNLSHPCCLSAASVVESSSGASEAEQRGARIAMSFIAKVLDHPKRYRAAVLLAEGGMVGPLSEIARTMDHPNCFEAADILYRQDGSLHPEARKAGLDAMEAISAAPGHSDRRNAASLLAQEQFDSVARALGQAVLKEMKDDASIGDF